MFKIKEQTIDNASITYPDAQHHADFKAERHDARHDGHAAVLAKTLGQVARVAGVEEPHARTYTVMQTTKHVSDLKVCAKGWKRPRGRPRTTWAEQLRKDLDGMGL